MKKVSSILLGILLLSNGFGLALAAQSGTADYEKMKAYKQSQREKKSHSQTSAEKGFWQKEAERSGFAGTAAMVSNAVSGALPLDKPNSRK